MASQSVCEVSTPQRVQLSPPLLQGDEISAPGLAMSPPTPRTTSSQAPVTPVNQFFGAPFSSFRSRENALETSDSASLSSREFDPTALFVGGLEIMGPSAWTQEKVEVFFGRFRGLLHVKFVCPRECLPYTLKRESSILYRQILQPTVMLLLHLSNMTTQSLRRRQSCKR